MIKQSIQIEKKFLDDRESAELLKKALLEKENLDVSGKEAALISSLPLYKVESALFFLAHQYPSSIQVGNSGELLFHFDSLELKSKESSYQLKLKQLKRFISNISHPTSRVIALILSLPLLVLIGGNILGISHGLYSILPSVAAAWLSLIVMALAIPVIAAGGIWIIIIFGTYLYPFLMVAYGLFAAGYSFIQMLKATKIDSIIGDIIIICLYLGVAALGFFLAVLAVKKVINAIAEKKSYLFFYWNQIAGFIFGNFPERQDPLADEKDLMELIQVKKGIIVASDLMEIFGWDYQEVDNEIVRILVDYEGEILVTDSGEILYRFSQLVHHINNNPPKKTKLTPSFQKIIFPKFFNCPRWMWITLISILIPGFIGLIVHPKLILFPSLKQFLHNFSQGFGMALAQGLAGYLYIIPLGIPILRWPFWKIRQKILKKEKSFRELIHRAVQNPEGFYADTMSISDLVRLEGEVNMDKLKGKENYYFFPRMEREQKAALALRNAK